MYDKWNMRRSERYICETSIREESILILVGCAVSLPLLPTKKDIVKSKSIELVMKNMAMIQEYLQNRLDHIMS